MAGDVHSHPDHRGRGVIRATLPGVLIEHRAIGLVDDGQIHDVGIVLGVSDVQ